MIEYWNDGVRGCSRRILQRANSPSLQLSVFPQHLLERAVFAERLGAVNIVFEVGAGFDQGEDDVVGASFGDDARRFL